MKLLETQKLFVGIFLIAIMLALISFLAYSKYDRIVSFVKPSPINIITKIEDSKIGTSTQPIPLVLEAGLEITVFAKDLPKARVLLLDPSGRLLVSLPGAGQVIALTDTDADGKAEKRDVVLSGLRRPHGLALDCFDVRCSLYVAEESRVMAYEYAASTTGMVTNGRKVVDLPAGGNHTTRTLLLKEVDGRKLLLVSVGSSCNACQESDSRRAVILAADLASGEVEVYAKGLRNSVFMAVNPLDGKIWATEMGRDFLGDNLPPDEINIIEQGKNYGWPVCYGDNIHDVNYDKNIYIQNPCQEPQTTASWYDLPAHVAPLGIAFFPENGWPEDYRRSLLVALHGSWNRSEPAGYKIIRLKTDPAGHVISAEDFLTGWLTPDRKQLGRPVDILIRQDGMIYFSDDERGAIYRVKTTFKPST